VHVQNGAQVQGDDNPLDQGEFLAARGGQQWGASIARKRLFYPAHGGAAWIPPNSGLPFCDVTLSFWVRHQN
jgi:hypothetical protein